MSTQTLGLVTLQLVVQRPLSRGYLGHEPRRVAPRLPAWKQAAAPRSVDLVRRSVRRVHFEEARCADRQQTSGAPAKVVSVLESRTIGRRM